jgi:Ca2+-dependent lipid-binding protein
MSKELGTLVVVVLKARNLMDKNSFSKQDPYAKLILNGPALRMHMVFSHSLCVSLLKHSIRIGCRTFPVDVARYYPR